MPDRRTPQTEAREQRNLQGRIDAGLANVVDMYAALMPRQGRGWPRLLADQQTRLRQEIVDRLRESQ